jgi:hypothetical protein
MLALAATTPPRAIPDHPSCLLVWDTVLHTVWLVYLGWVMMCVTLLVQGYLRGL